MIRHLTTMHVLTIHADLIRRFGGDPAVLKPNMVDYCVSLTRMTVHDRPVYPTLIEKAAALGHALLAEHCFADGNKRVAFGALDIFLRINGYKISAKVEDAAAAVRTAASAGPAPQEDQDDLTATRHSSAEVKARVVFTKWVRQHTVPLVAE